MIFYMIFVALAAIFVAMLHVASVISRIRMTISIAPKANGTEITAERE